MVAWRGSKRVRSSRAPLSFIDPCLPVLAPKAPSGDLWIHEIKHDGYRLQIHVRGERVRLYTMTGVDWTERYPWIVQDVARLGIRSAIIDAEAVCCGDDGVTDFNRLHDASVFAYAFDAMQIDGDDLRPLPVEDRKARLAKALKRAKPGIRYNEAVEGDGPTIYAHACKLGLEGIVSKRVGSRYRSGKSKAWVKTKNPKSPAYMRIVEGGF